MPETPVKNKTRKRWKKVVFAIVLILLLAAGSAAVWFHYYGQAWIDSYAREQIEKSFAEAFPDYSLQIGKIRFDLGKRTLYSRDISARSNDSGPALSIDAIRIRRIKWEDLVFGGPAWKAFLKSSCEIDSIGITSEKSRYFFSCRSLRVSAADSTAEVAGLIVKPLYSDEDFFASSEYRRTRFDMEAANLSLKGYSLKELFAEKKYHARELAISDIRLDILLNKEKGLDKKDTARPLMPQQLLASVKKSLAVGRLAISNCDIVYGERMETGKPPGILTFDNMNVEVTGIKNRFTASDSITLNVTTDFQNTAAGELRVAIPLAAKGTDFTYAGTLTGFDATKLNTFLIRAEHHKVKSGKIRSARYSAEVRDGKASGTLLVIYEDLYVAILDKKTNSDKGVLNKIFSFIANTFKFRTENIQDDDEPPVKGKISYTAKRQDAFLETFWFSLRSGLADVVGF